jgi:hypothetical protein
MTVEQLIAALQRMPARAVVLIEGDAGYARVGGLNVEHSDDSMPDEVILLPSMEDD